jgi:hypothetical protein
LAHSWANYCLPDTLGEGAGWEQRSIGRWKLSSVGSNNNFIGWSGELPCPELTNVLDAPKSNMASAIASSIALASSWLDAQSTFQRSSCRAHRCADVAMGFGLASVTGRAISV